MIRTQRPATHPESRLERGGLVMEIGRDSATMDSPIQGAEKDVIARFTHYCLAGEYAHVVDSV